jgi:hypothetical protein
MKETGLMLIIAGIVIVIVGFSMYYEKFIFGKLPGDFVIDKGNFKMYLPIGTSILISIIITIIMIIFNAIKK